MHNPFSLFDLPVQFRVDQALLSERYLALQKALHPDNFSSATAAEQRAAVQKSAEINDALQVLKDPVKRAEAIIALHTGNAQNVEEKSLRDTAFLMQQLEWRETLESIENAKNDEKLTAFAREIEGEQKTILTQLEQALDTQEWQKAEQISDKLRYTRKLLLEIERVEEKILDF